MMEELQAYSDVWAAARRFGEERARLAELCAEIQQIAAPTGHEAARAAWVAAKLAAAGIADIEQDALWNVYGRIPGRSAERGLMVSAHTDTVFALDTDLALRWDDDEGRIWGPGIGDNATGVAALVVLAETLMRLSPPPVDVWLVANTNEEGLGDLRGMRAVVERLHAQLGACIVVEGMGVGRIVHRGLGSRRLRVAVSAPGGHSWSDFGAASAIHVLVRLAAEIARLRVPETPRTTFNIGRIVGGTSVNSIAQHAMLELDLRSEDGEMLRLLVERVQEIVNRYRGGEWLRQNVQVMVDVIGDRPSGSIQSEHPLVQAAIKTVQAAGYRGPIDLRISSTDANIPLSLGIPAVCVGVTEGGNAHRLEEWISVGPLAQGMSYLLLLTWWAAQWLAGERPA